MMSTEETAADAMLASYQWQTDRGQRSKPYDTMLAIGLLPSLPIISQTIRQLPTMWYVLF